MLGGMVGALDGGLYMIHCDDDRRDVMADGRVDGGAVGGAVDDINDGGDGAWMAVCLAAWLPA